MGISWLVVLYFAKFFGGTPAREEVLREDESLLTTMTLFKIRDSVKDHIAGEVFADKTVDHAEMRDEFWRKSGSHHMDKGMRLHEQARHNEPSTNHLVHDESVKDPEVVEGDFHHDRRRLSSHQTGKKITDSSVYVYGPDRAPEPNPLGGKRR